MMSDLNCYVATFNCGRTLASVDHLAANLFNGLKTNLPPDLVVLSLEEIAPISHSFLGGSFLAPYFARFETVVHVATAKRFESEGEYESILVRNVGMTAIMIFARESIRNKMKWIETAGVGVGWWEMGNKGAVAARIGLPAEDASDKEMIMTFVAAHLAPMEWAWEQRNRDWKNICEGLVFQLDGVEGRTTRPSQDDPSTEPLLVYDAERSSKDGQHSLFSPISHIYFSGDLNYRTSDVAPKPEDVAGWPQPVDSVSDIHYYGHLFEHDQLTREKSKNKTLHQLTEAEIEFPPTYKYSEKASEMAAQDSLKPDTDIGGDKSWLWAKHRVPSWCDRILYLQAAPPTVHSYTALPVQPTSDHRPVVLSFSLPFKPAEEIAGEVKPPFPINPHWKEARAAARRYEFLVGLAAYLTLTWEGEALLGGTIAGLVGGWLVIRALIGT